MRLLRIAVLVIAGLGVTAGTANACPQRVICVKGHFGKVHVDHCIIWPVPIGGVR